jgi:hypothetical protein
MLPSGDGVWQAESKAAHPAATLTRQARACASPQQIDVT